MLAASGGVSGFSRNLHYTEIQLKSGGFVMSEQGGEPITKGADRARLRCLVIGAGMSGILSGINILSKNYKLVSIVEKADKIGGTWRENTYPGLTCDVPSHAYTYSFAANPEWTRALPPGAEIQAYFEGVVEHYGLKPYLAFSEEIVACQWRQREWLVRAKSGREWRADVVIAATGVLHHRRMPDIPGLEHFEGHCFHTSRWDHTVELADKRIGVIGNGSTGVQIISALAGEVARLSHFQRTPQWIMPVENPAFTEEQRAAFRTNPALMEMVRNDPTYVESVRRFTEAVANPDSPEMAEIEAVVAANLEEGVADPVLRDKLRPTYRAACKRLIFSPDYYQAIQRERTELVTESIERVEAGGIRTKDGKLHELDVIALATGFHADKFMRPMQVEGRNGATLERAWARSPRAYYSVSIPDFPNFFMLNGPNGPVGNFSLIDVAEKQWAYISHLLEALQAGRAKEISASQSALDEFDARRTEAARSTVFGSGCSSWYLDAEGVPATWPWSFQRFAEEMQSPRWEDFELLA